MEKKANPESQSEHFVGDMENYQAKIDQLASEYNICAWCQQECLDNMARERKMDRIAYDDLTLREKYDVLNRSTVRGLKRNNPEGRKDFSHGICCKHEDEMKAELGQMERN